MKFMIVDDNRDDRMLAIREVRKGFPDAEFVEVAGVDGFESALDAGPFDAIVTDYWMGWMDGLDVLRRAKALHPTLPVLMVTGTGGEEVAVAAMKLGADDYILKSQLRFDRLPRAVAAAIDASHHRAALAAAERRYGELFRSIPVGLCRCALDGTIVEANPALATLLDVAETAELEGSRLPERFVSGDAWRTALDGGAPEVRLEGRGAGEAWVVLRARRVAVDGPTAVECALTDITDARSAADERGALLGELYHRVNNTLQLLVGMITMQRGRTSDPAARLMLDDLVARIHAISLVQQRLYETGTFTELGFDDFLRDLVESIPFPSTVACDLRLSPVRLPVSRAIPLGLAANELLTNCVKHAFPQARRGTVTVRLADDDSGTVLEIVDDGVGVDPTVERREGYGVRLLQRLVAQADGTTDRNSMPEGGTRVTIRLRPDTVIR